jgi:ABC-type multidrug transport system fused ATPase/permease subunit
LAIATGLANEGASMVVNRRTLPRVTAAIDQIPRAENLRVLVNRSRDATVRSSDRHDIREARSEPWRCPTRQKGVSVMLLLRSRVGEQLTRRLRCWRNTVVPILQAAVAAGLSWLVAVQVVEHRVPCVAPVAAVVCLDLTLGQRLRRAIELIVGGSSRHRRRRSVHLRDAPSGSTVAAIDPDPVIRVVGVRKVFGLAPVLDGVSLDVHSGETVGLLGPNGTGKTTLLKILATVIRPTRGAARVAGHDCARDPEHVRREVGLLAHESHLYEDLTAMENLAFWQRFAGERVRNDSLRAVLEEVELDHCADLRVRTFSAVSRPSSRLAPRRALLEP